MKPIEIRYEDLYYILNCARIKLKSWYKDFNEKQDEICLNKVENILKEIQQSTAIDFLIDEMPF